MLQKFDSESVDYLIDFSKKICLSYQTSRLKTNGEIVIYGSFAYENLPMGLSVALVFVKDKCVNMIHGEKFVKFNLDNYTKAWQEYRQQHPFKLRPEQVENQCVSN